MSTPVKLQHSNESLLVESQEEVMWRTTRRVFPFRQAAPAGANGRDRAVVVIEIPECSRIAFSLPLWQGWYLGVDA